MWVRAVLGRPAESLAARAIGQVLPRIRKKCFVTKLRERLDSTNTVSTLLVEAGARAGPTAASTLRLAQIGTRKARLDGLREIAGSYEEGRA
jgi:hypothetical protein